MSESAFSDDELWNSVVMDNSKDFAILYNRYWKKLYKTAYYYLKDAEASEEILQDVFVVLWNKRKHLKIKNFNNYVYIAARYHVFSYLRAAKLDPIEYIEQYSECLMPPCYNNVEEKLNYNDFKLGLEQNLKVLPKRCREIFWMSRVENVSNDEIAIRLGISKRTVENQITHALNHLRSLDPHLFSTALVLLFLSNFQ